MRIVLHLDRARLFRWRRVLADRLAAQGHDVRATFAAVAEPLPVSLTALLDFDRVRARSGPERLSVRIGPGAFDDMMAPAGFAADLTLDLATSSRIVRLPGRVLRPLYDGSAKDIALYQTLLDGRAPRLELADTDSDNAWAIGLPALERPHHFAMSLDAIASRLIEGVNAVVMRIEAGERAPADGDTGARRRAASQADASMLASIGAFAAHRASRKTARLRDRIMNSAAKWHVAWRLVGDDAATAAPGLLSISDFQVLPDDGHRFFADPLVFAHQGARHMFFEELADSLGYGVISHAIIGDDGGLGPITTVLDTGGHLSYPFVFARDGDIWMIPESSSAGGVDLYRAAHFPDAWTCETRLLDGLLHDATLFEHGGLLWIAAGSEALQSSTWDGLSLFYAETLKGPWRPHARNPVIVDARFARPAGAPWSSGGALCRPAQDCSGGYGGKISIRRIEELTPDTFREATAGAIAFSADSRLLGPHTISRAAGVEAIDVYARRRDVRAFCHPGHHRLS